jgi:hypothetical protein
VAAVEALLGVGDLLELAAVEEDPSTTLALLDVYASPVDGMHPVLTLRTDHPAETSAAGCEVRMCAPTTTPGRQQAGSSRRRPTPLAHVVPALEAVSGQ